MFVFVDETGELNDFSPTGSTYFGLTAVVLKDLIQLSVLHQLRYDLHREGHAVERGIFHCKNDPNPRRYRVCETIGKMSGLSAHSVFIRKDRIYPYLRGKTASVFGIATETLFYYLFKYKAYLDSDSYVVFATFGASELKNKVESMQIASVKSAKRRANYPFRVDLIHCDAGLERGLQVADYLAWVIQRKLERDDSVAATCISALGPIFKEPFLLWDS
jgi:hypothetical protein